MNNSYFGSTLTDAQNARTQGGQLDLAGDESRRQMLGRMMAGLLQQRQEQGVNNRFGQEIGLRRDELGQHGQNAQMQQLMQAMALALQQRQMEQQGSQFGQSVELQKYIADKQFNPALSNRFDSAIWQEMMKDNSRADENTASLNANIQQENAVSQAESGRLNALVEALRQKASQEGSRMAINPARWFGSPMDSAVSNKVFQSGYAPILDQAKPGVSGAIVQPGPGGTFTPTMIPQRTNNGGASLMRSLQMRGSQPSMTNSMEQDPRVAMLMQLLQQASTNQAPAGTNRQPLIRYDPKSGRPVAYDPVTKQAIGWAD